MADDFDPAALLVQIKANLDGIARFWRQRGIDPAGGYHTIFSANGKVLDDPRKTLIAQTRILWTYSTLAQVLGDESFLPMAAHGFHFLVDQFHDERFGGWYWAVGGDAPDDHAKLMYGQSFALYALCAYAASSGSAEARDLAVETFDAMHNAADVAYGGFWENIGVDWTPENTQSGRRKSLDIHLHLLEAFTALAQLTGDPTHLRRLREVRQLLLDKMVDPVFGIGGTQYDAAWTPLEPIVISRTWIAERIGDEAQPPGQFTTSYGHNLELGWLLGWADDVLDGDSRLHTGLVDRMGAHTLRYGYDATFGGVYREGPPLGAATDTDKEFWQNAESLTGFLHLFELTGKPEYAEAFSATWSFAKQHLIHPGLQEWHIRTTRDGTMIDDSLGNQWTGGYHTVRAPIECVRRLNSLLR